MKSQIKNKKKGNKFRELLIPTLNKISSYGFVIVLLEGKNNEKLSQNNQFAWLLSPLKYEGELFF